MQYYDTHGHSEHLQLSTLDEALASEREFPNSTLDARRMVVTADGLLGGRRPCRMLDVGCGYGFYSRAALDLGFTVDALELASTERRIATELTGIAPAAVSFEEYPEQPGRYDAILMSQILEHAQDVNAWLDKSHRMLAPGGVLIVALPNFGSLLRRILNENDPWVTPPAHLNYFSRASLETAFARHGFELAATQWASRVPPRVYDRRLPRFARPLKPLVAGGVQVALKLVDALRLGMMITAYGRRLP